MSHADSLRQDFLFFKEVLHNNYPSLYRYTDSLEINKLFENCRAAINDSTSDLDFLKTLKFIFSAIKDGHLYAGPSAGLRENINERTKMFPIRLYFTGDKAFVLSYQGNNPEAGSEIISVNSKPVNQVRAELFKYIVSDGAIETKKYYILNSSFCVYYLMVYGEQDKFDVTYKSAKGELKAVSLKASLKKDIPEITEDDKSKNLLGLSFINNAALLSIKTFDSSALAGNKLDFRLFLENAFKRINAGKLDKLIVDLRGNGGGRDLYGSLLYSYISNKEFNYYKSLKAVTKLLPFDQFTSPGSSYNNLSPSMLESIDGKYYNLTKTAHPNLQIIQPAKNSFSGKVFFLVDGLSFSTTAEFCSIAKSNKRGIFIGEETGGSYYGNTSGAVIDTILPNTKMIVSFGTIAYEMAVTKGEFPDRGIIPDYIVKPGITDIISKRDVQLNYVMKLLND